MIDESSVEEEDDKNDYENDKIRRLEQNPSISIISKSSTFSNHTTERALVCDSDDKSVESSEEQTQEFNWNQLSADLSSKNNEDSNKEDSEQQADTGDTNIENAGSLLQNFLMEHQRRNPNEVSLSSNLPNSETAEYVPLEKLAETVNTCRVCNEKFKDITHLDEHRSKAGHYQCNIPECSSLIFHSPMEVSVHRAQVHGTPLSPSVSQLSPHQLSNSPHLSRTSPQLNAHSPHVATATPVETSSTNSSQQLSRTSPHETNSSAYNATAVTSGATSQQIQIPPVNFEQLPPPVQQLAQQVQRMPLPQTQMPPSLPPGASTMIPGPNYFVQPPGRPPLYRVPGPQSLPYPPHMAHLYQYPSPYPQMAAPPPQMHPQLSQVPRGRYPSPPVVQNSR